MILFFSSNGSPESRINKQTCLGHLVLFILTQSLITTTLIYHDKLQKKLNYPSFSSHPFHIIKFNVDRLTHKKPLIISTSKFLQLFAFKMWQQTSAKCVLEKSETEYSERRIWVERNSSIVIRGSKIPSQSHKKRKLSR